MGALEVFTLRFPPQRFATLMGIFISVGTLGSILAASPLAYLASAVGWRMTFILAGSANAFLACMDMVGFAGKEKGMKESLASRPPPKETSIFQSMRLILKSFTFWKQEPCFFQIRNLC